MSPSERAQSRIVQSVKVPSFFYGTAWKEEETAPLTRLALDAGFRAIDTVVGKAMILTVDGCELRLKKDLLPRASSITDPPGYGFAHCRFEVVLALVARRGTRSGTNYRAAMRW